MQETVLRDELIAQLTGGQAYSPVEEIVCGFPPEFAGRRLSAVRHTPWELLEHLRIAQWDILRFTVDPVHTSPPFPAGYWPAADAPAGEEEWSRSVETFLAELSEVKHLARNPAIDLFSVIPHGNGQTVLREILLVADHNAYHLGQFLLVRRALGA